MDADHQGVVTFVFLDHLQGTGLVGVATVERVAQEEHDGLVAGKLGSLIDGMTKAALLFLIDIVEALADVEDMVLILLGLGIELAQMFLL
jgi:hypothetical protein